MQFVLNKLSINGAKNIDKTIDLQFTNKTIYGNNDFTNSNIKAIYGPNGSGKSAIISIMYIYKRLINDIDGITDKVFSNFILDTINKETNLLTIDVVFTDVNKTNKNCFKHHIDLHVSYDIVSIIKEEVSILKGKTITDDNFKPLIKIENGSITYLQTDKDLNIEPLYINSMNLLNKYSVSSTIWKLIKQDKDTYIGDDEVITSLIEILLFTNNIVVELNKEDIHFDYITQKIIEKKYFNEEKVSEMLNNLLNKVSPSDYLITLSTQNRDIVDESNISNYEFNIIKLLEFIKLFKPDLDNIEIDKKINDNVYYCDKIFVYGKKRINIEFESTGIKKLVKLYQALRLCANGAIAFIDEMDANLHDVYFTKLIEFFKNDSKGQLCFTTHNLEPIDILKSNSHSLDFISNDSRIYSWIKDGNKSPMNKYIHGLIPYSPFNVEAFDFDILLDEEI